MICKKCKTPLPDSFNFCPKCGACTTAAARKKTRRPNGTGYARKRGKTWQAEVAVGKKKNKDGKIVPEMHTKGGFATRAEALAYVDILKRQRGVGKKKTVTTLASLWENYSSGAMLKLSKNKQSHYRTAFSRLNQIELTPIKELTIDDLQDVVNKECVTYYPARDIKNLLSHLYERAAAQQDVISNLAQYIVLPDLEEKSPFPFSAEDIKALWGDYGKGNKIAGFILLMIYSGMMPGELFICQKDMIDWDARKIIGCGLKTKKRKATPLLVADFMIPILQDLCKLSAGDNLLPIRPEKFYQEFHKTLARCKIEDRTPYACRHTTATALALGNIAPLVIQEIMRHSKFSTTERYIHIEKDQKEMLNALDSLK